MIINNFSLLEANSRFFFWLSLHKYDESIYCPTRSIKS